MNIAICDDNKVFVKGLKKFCTDYLFEKNLDGELFEFYSGEQLLFHIKETEIDVLLLDICMEGISGIDVKNKLEEKKSKTVILFLTGYDSHIKEAFGKNVIAFLTKPIKREELFEKLDRVVNGTSERNLVIDIHKGTAVNIKQNTILYIKAEDRYSTVKTSENIYFVCKAMKYWENILSNYGFYRIHRSVIVNLEHIIKIEQCVFLANGEEIKISRRKIKEVKEIYRKFLVGKSE